MTGQHRDIEWFDSVYEYTYPAFKRAGRFLLARFCPALENDLEDLLNEAYIAMFKKRVRLYNHPNILGWLVVALKYILFHRIRKWNKEMRMLCKLKLESEAVPWNHFDTALGHEDAEELMKAAIGEEKYTILREYHITGTSIEELALRYGVKAGTMHTRLSRWKKRCELILSREGILSIIILWATVNFHDFWV